MQMIGFNLSKIFFKKEKNFSVSNINTNIEFKNFEKEEVSLLKDQEALKIDFLYKITYNSQKNKEEKLGEIEFEGSVIMTSTTEEVKEVLKNWKKKQVSQNLQVPLFNLIMRKCLPKIIFLTDEMGLPSPIAMPKLELKKKEDQ